MFTLETVRKCAVKSSLVRVSFLLTLEAAVKVEMGKAVANVISIRAPGFVLSSTGAVPGNVLIHPQIHC